MALIKLRYVRPKERVLLKHPETREWVLIDPGTAHRTDDVLVRKFPDAFEADEDREIEKKG